MKLDITKIHQVNRMDPWVVRCFWSSFKFSECSGTVTSHGWLEESDVIEEISSKPDMSRINSNDLPLLGADDTLKSLAKFFPTRGLGNPCFFSHVRRVIVIPWTRSREKMEHLGLPSFSCCANQFFVHRRSQCLDLWRKLFSLPKMLWKMPVSIICLYPIYSSLYVCPVNVCSCLLNMSIFRSMSLG